MSEPVSKRSPLSSGQGLQLQGGQNVGLRLSPFAFFMIIWHNPLLLYNPTVAHLTPPPELLALNSLQVVGLGTERMVM